MGTDAMIKYFHEYLPLCFRSGLGNHYGTLSGPIGAFSPQDKARKAYKTPGKNIYTNPGRKGTGFG